MALLAILSDTHDNIPPTELVIQDITTHQPDYVLHCGDFTTPDTLRLFRGTNLECVYGNCDYDKTGLSDTAAELGFSPIGYTKELTIEQKKIFMLHGDNQTTLSHAIHSQSFDYIFHGHTHEQKDILVGTTRVINPGALSRAKILTYATLDLSTDTLQVHAVE